MVLSVLFVILASQCVSWTGMPRYGPAGAPTGSFSLQELAFFARWVFRGAAGVTAVIGLLWDRPRSTAFGALLLWIVVVTEPWR